MVAEFGSARLQALNEEVVMSTQHAVSTPTGCPISKLGSESDPTMADVRNDPQPFFAQTRSEEPVFYKLL